MTPAKRKSTKPRTKASRGKPDLAAIAELAGNLEELNRWQLRLLQKLRLQLTKKGPGNS